MARVEFESSRQLRSYFAFFSLENHGWQLCVASYTDGRMDVALYLDAADRQDVSRPLTSSSPHSINTIGTQQKRMKRGYVASGILALLFPMQFERGRYKRRRMHECEVETSVRYLIPRCQQTFVSISWPWRFHPRSSKRPPGAPACFQNSLSP